MYFVKTTPITSVTTSAVVPVSGHSNQSTAWQVSGVTTATYSVEFTLDNIYDTTVTPTWVAVPSGSGLTANGGNFVTGPVRGLRLNVTAWTAGSVVLKVLQGSPQS